MKQNKNESKQSIKRNKQVISAHTSFVWSTKRLRMFKAKCEIFINLSEIKKKIGEKTLFKQWKLVCFFPKKSLLNCTRTRNVIHLNNSLLCKIDSFVFFLLLLQFFCVFVISFFLAAKERSESIKFVLYIPSSFVSCFFKCKLSVFICIFHRFCHRLQIVFRIAGFQMIWCTFGPFGPIAFN